MNGCDGQYGSILGGNPKTLFDLGASYNLDHVDIWYVVAKGMASNAPASVTYTVGAGAPVLVTGFPTTDGAHQFTIDLTGQSGQTVQLDFVNGGPDWWAVNEIQFFAAPPAPEMNVTGNGQDIADGSATPSAGNHTDFGGALVAGGQVTRTFTIENTGTAALSLTGTPIVVISGAQSNDFAVALEPADSVAAGASTTFQVTFDPSADGHCGPRR